jgi:hypothetical protein
MKKLLFFVVACVFALIWVGVQADIPKLINYQGMLTDDGGDPLNGTPDIAFRIYNASSGGTLRWNETHSSVPVADGLFNVILGSQSGGINLDFSEDYWLEIEVDSDTMPERLQFTSVGYAYRAMVADSALAAAPGSGSNWHLGSSVLQTNGYWGIARYGNTSYGYHDSTHVNLGVTCTTGTLGQSYKYCTVAGGKGNKASHYQSTVGGGVGNIASGQFATVGGGNGNQASGTDATVGGGVSNHASGEDATVGGGMGNTATGNCATVGGGDGNSAAGSRATVGGGEDNTASSEKATVAGGYLNMASNYQATVGGGYHNTASGQYATVGGGWQDTASGDYATVGGGYHNIASGDYATVGGGRGNTTSGYRATVGGGYHNTASGEYATAPGGRADTAAGDYSLAAGSHVRTTSDADYTFAFGRDFTTSTPNAVIFHNSVDPIKVGIGTTDPDRAMLDVAHATDALRLRAGNQESQYSDNQILLSYQGTADHTHAIKTRHRSGGPSGNAIDFYVWDQSTDHDTAVATKHVMTIDGADVGRVGINTNSPGYSLDVVGTINVDGSYSIKKGGVSYNHPDYVFEPDYKLMPLDELREYVREKKCLPNVISAEDVKKNEGFKIDELLIQMLEKIEEQTLYIFQLEERIAKLEKKE